MQTRGFRERLAANKKAVEELAGCEETIGRICAMLVDAFKSGKRLWLAGNGGSAADAQHVAGELMGRLHRNRQALPAVALPGGGAVGTCISNDFGYEQVFSRQLEGLAGQGDVVWLLSTSGHSPNIVAAAKVAKQKGCRVIAFTGPKDSPVAALADVTLQAAGDRTDLIQEAHQVAYHFICQQVEAAF